MQFIPKCKQTSTIPGSNEVQVSASTFEDHRHKRADFTVIHDSPSIGAGPDTALFRKLKGGEPSDKVLSWRAAIKRVTWQLLMQQVFMFAFCSCNSIELKCYIWP